MNLCRHNHEVLCARAEAQGMGLRCTACGRERPHPWGGQRAAYTRTQEPGRTEAPNGIQREIERCTTEAAQIADALARIEMREKRERAGLRVVSRYGGKS